ncbi:Uncharacterised protein [Mycobacteroides abscessus subsp. abscessus]|nr:Uncharacterised protein [Mycobacteroides abscessus subsp. abscessus]
MVARITADFPDAVIGLVPSAFNGKNHVRHQVPVGIGQRIGMPEMLAGVAQIVDQFHHGAEYIQLHLRIGGVADTNRSRARIPWQ